jgi:hypothetical protein
LALIVCPEFKDEIGHGNPFELICFHGWGIDAGASLIRTMVANRTTDFDPDWIGMIVLLVLDLIKLQLQLYSKSRRTSSKCREESQLGDSQNLIAASCAALEAAIGTCGGGNLAMMPSESFLIGDLPLG